MPDLPLYILQALLLPDVLYYVCEILHFHLLRMARGLTRRPTSPSLDRQVQRKGMFNQASNFSLSSNVLIDNNANNATINIYNSDKFMGKLLRATIRGAAFDSSARDPPPRCHPGTRLAILERCVAFVVNRTGERKMRWVVGAAGVGKSAIMQSVAEHPFASVTLRASIFFFVDGRSDGSKAVVTLAYQLAVQCESYRQFIKEEIAHDPSLLQKSMSVQFDKFIIEPFIHRPHLNGVGRVLIIIDGLDECDQSRLQRELLRLISDFCLAYPSSPIVWMIASRPESHITSFFAQASVEAAYEKEEILVESHEAREDVERFLRAELMKMKNEFLLHYQVQWPSEKDFWRLASASGGLFVYAQTVVKYIGDPDIGDPTGQLKDVLEVIDAHPLPNVPREEHPMALLDALYARILSKVPTKIMKNARKLLLALVICWELLCTERERNFIVLCNWLGITCDEAHAVIRHLSSVLYLSSDGRSVEDSMKQLRCFHKSFLDYLSDPARSEFSPDIKLDARQLFFQCTCRILEQSPDGVGAGDIEPYITRGVLEKIILTRGLGTGDNISLTWPVDETSDWHDSFTRFCMYNMAFANAMNGFLRGEQTFRSLSFIRHLTAHVVSLSEPTAQSLCNAVFDLSRRHEFMEQGLLQRIPIKMLTTWDVGFTFRLVFHRSTTPNSNLSHPCDPSCAHEWLVWGKGAEQFWSTRFNEDPESRWGCGFCYHRFEYQLESWKVRLPDYPVLVSFNSAGLSFVEFHFVDPEDGISEWTYQFCHAFTKQERKMLGSPV